MIHVEHYLQSNIFVYAKCQFNNNLYFYVNKLNLILFLDYKSNASVEIETNNINSYGNIVESIKNVDPIDTDNHNVEMNEKHDFVDNVDLNKKVGSVNTVNFNDNVVHNDDISRHLTSPR